MSLENKMKRIRNLGIAGILAAALSLETPAQESTQQEAPATQQAQQPVVVQPAPMLEETMKFVVEKVELYGGSPVMYDMVHELSAQNKNTVTYNGDCHIQITEQTNVKFNSGKLQTNTTTIDVLLGMARIDALTKGDWIECNILGPCKEISHYNITIYSEQGNVFRKRKQEGTSLASEELKDSASIYLTNKDIAERVRTALEYAIRLCSAKREPF